jgi:hypothetical protein
MREQAISRCDTPMQDIMSKHVASRDHRDGSYSHLEDDDFDETKLLEIWKEIVRQLASSPSDGEPENVVRARNADLAVSRSSNSSLGDSDLRGYDDHYLVWRSQSVKQDYLVGASLAFNPFAVFHANYTCKSDFAALAGDWEEIRSDMVDGWTALIRDDPAVKRLVERSLEKERATRDEPAT